MGEADLGRNVGQAARRCVNWGAVLSLALPICKMG